MEHKSHGSPSFINIAVLLLFAVVIAVASVVTTYFVLNLRSNQQYSADQPSVIPQTQMSTLPTPTSTTQIQTVSDETADWKVYKNEKYGFEVKYPTNWGFTEFSPNPPYNLLGMEFANPPPSPYTERSTGILLYIWPYSLEKAIKEFEKYPVGISRENIILPNNVPAKKVQGKYQGTLGGPDEIYEGTTATAVFIEQNNRVYELRFNEKDLIDSTVFDQMLSTFKFLK